MTRECAKCPAIADCKQAFGVFWREKSSDGAGCSSTFAGWPEGWREKLAVKAAVEPVADKPDARRGRHKLVWQGEF